ncbi:hypothetical protein Pelo_17852 [Pelomyxa schiedti]|nr:hypothetical protein Pelo_17852 [Pelomyxa schiedti]
MYYSCASASFSAAVSQKNFEAVHSTIQAHRLTRCTQNPVPAGQRVTNIEDLTLTNYHETHEDRNTASQQHQWDCHSTSMGRVLGKQQQAVEICVNCDYKSGDNNTLWAEVMEISSCQPSQAFAQESGFVCFCGM